MQEALRRSGAHPTGFSQGDVFLVPNAMLRLELDMHRHQPPAAKHRPVVVMDSDPRCRDSRILTALVVPLTRRIADRAPTTYLLPAGSAGLDADSLALVHLLQPLHRGELLREGTRIGRVTEQQCVALLAKLALAVGMVEPDNDV